MAVVNNECIRYSSSAITAFDSLHQAEKPQKSVVVVVVAVVAASLTVTIESCFNYSAVTPLEYQSVVGPYHTQASANTTASEIAFLMGQWSYNWYWHSGFVHGG